MTEFEFYSLIISSISSVAVIVAAIYASYQFHRSANIHNMNLNWNKRIETRKKLDLFSKDSNIILDKTFNFISRKQPIPIEEILDAIKCNEVKIHLYLLFDFYEAIAGGIRAEIYDENLVKSAKKGVMIRNYIFFKNFIEHERREGKPQLYLQYEELVLKWNTEESNEKTDFSKLEIKKPFLP